MECRICRTDGWWDQQGHKILAWTQIVSRQSASLCSFNSEKFILCNLLLPADTVDKVSLVYLLSTCCDIVWQLGPCNVTWPGMCWSQVARSRGWTVLLDQAGTMVPPGTSQTPLPPAQTGSRDGSATCKARLCRPTSRHYFALLWSTLTQALVACYACLMIFVPPIVLTTTTWATNICILLIYKAFSWHNMAL